MAKKYFALTKWIGGTDDKKLTPGVPVEWILNFNHEEYKKDDHDPSESYVVEWRSGKKPPKGGWKCYDCHIIAVSDRISTLENRLKIIDGIQSPKSIRSVKSDLTKDPTTVPARRVLVGKKRCGSAEHVPEKSPETRSPPTKSKRQKESRVTSNVSASSSYNILQSSDSEDVDGGNDDERTSQNEKVSTCFSKYNKSMELLHERSESPIHSTPRYESQSSASEDQDSEKEEETKTLPKKQSSNSKSVPKQNENQQTAPIRTKSKGSVERTDKTEQIPRQARSTSPARSVNPGVIEAEADDAGHTASDEKELTLKDIMSVLKKNDASIRKLTKDVEELKTNKGVPAVRQPLSTRNSVVHNVAESDDDDFAVGRVEVGRPRSGLTVSELEWTSAISKGTYTAMATTLLTALFPMQVLLKSNYKGGKCKIKKSENDPAPNYEALDQRIVKAIKCETCSRKRVLMAAATATGVARRRLAHMANREESRDLPATP